MPATKQTLFFTATWPKEVKAMAAQYLTQEGRVVQISIGGNDSKLVANKNISQEVRELTGSAKPAALAALLDEKQQATKCKVMVFCNTKIDCERQSQARPLPLPAPTPTPTPPPTPTPTPTATPTNTPTRRGATRAMAR